MGREEEAARELVRSLDGGNRAKAIFQARTLTEHHPPDIGQRRQRTQQHVVALHRVEPAQAAHDQRRAVRPHL